MNPSRFPRVRLAVVSATLLVAACGGDPTDVADPEAAAQRQAAADVAVRPQGEQPRRKAVDANTAARARWSAPGTLPIVPVSMANLPDGKVLLWSAESRFQFNSGNGRTYTATYDPATGAVSERLVSETGHDMFCPGTAYLADGRLLVNGGIDAAATSLYDPATATWTRGGNMTIPRGYNASTPLADGSVFTLGGSWSGGAGNKHGEVWTAAGGWRRLSGVPVTPFLQAGGAWGGDSHMWLIPAGNGRVLHAGPQARMSWIDTQGNGAVTPIGPRGDDTDAVTGITVMYDTGRILKAGGMSQIAGDNTASRAAYVIDVNGGATVRKVAPMQYARTFHNSVVLPNGQVVIVGGQTRGVGFSNDYAVLRPELFDPVSETFTALPAMTKPRNYHSIAVLLPDGRVMSAGGGLCGANCAANQANFEILSPPYLFDASGQPAARPRITSAPAQVGHGTRVRVGADASVAAFAMVRLSSTTHTVNNDQRRVPIAFTSPSPGVFDLEIPSNPGVLLAGHWMLFAMNAQGTPSIAHTLRVTLDGTPALTAPGDQAGTVGAFARIVPRATDPAGRALTWSADGLPEGVSIDAATGVIAGTPARPGRHVVTLSVGNGQRTVSGWFVWTVSGSGGVRHVRFEALSEVGGNPWTAIAELDLLGSDGRPLARGAWTATADSQQLPEWPASAAIDGNPATAWITTWRGVPAPVPHWLQLDLGAPQDVAALRLLPRQDGTPNGTPARFRVWASADGVNWGVPVVEGDLRELGAWNQPKTVWLNNLAAGRPAMQSTTWEGDAGRAVDGNRDGQWSARSVTHTHAQPESWWQVDLGASQAIRAIRVWNRTDCCAERLAGFTVFVSDTDMTGRSRAALLADPTVWRWTQTGPLERATTATGATQGRFVRIVLPGTQYLSLAEVEVFGTAGANRPPAWGTLPRPVLVRGAAADVPLPVSDPDGDRLAFTATGLPAGLSIDPSTGAIRGTPQVSGDFAATVTATDSRGASARAPLAVSVDEPPIVIQPVDAAAIVAGGEATFTARATGGAGLAYRWDFGDGTPATAFGASPTVSHTYARAGAYTVTLTVRDASGATAVQRFVQRVDAPRAGQPTRSTNLAVEPRAAGPRLWVANPDQNTVSVIDPANRRRVAEIAVGAGPRSVAVAPDGRVWVTARDAATLSVIDAASLRVVATHALPRASQPYGLAFGHDGTAWVALAATGEVARVNANGTLRARIGVGADPRQLAVTGDGARVLVSRFVTPPQPGESTARVATAADGRPTGGQVVVVDVATGRVERTVTLAHSERADTTVSARGVPNYLGAPAIAPDGRSAWVPSKQDNIARGLLRDRQPLDFQTTVRAISSLVDLGTMSEVGDARVDHDNSSVASAAVFHPDGRLVFVALETSRQVAVIDAAARRELMRFDAGFAPQGIAVSPDGTALYVHNVMERSVGLYDLTRLLGGVTQVPSRGTVGTVGSERLPQAVLVGKRLFHDARDPRLAKDGYMSCASCHAEGGSDGRTWDFTGFGEGLRATVALRGRAGLAHGRLHWSGNFDELQDFEGQIRRFAGGTGLMRDADWNAGTRSQPLGDRAAGLSPDLDALAAYVASLDRFDPSPWRGADGQLSAIAKAGEALFVERGCATCHGGSGFTSSATRGPVDIGTIRQPTSGGRLGGALAGIDPPTLRDAWASAPYLHDGSAPTLADAIRAHRGLALPDAEVERLARYVAEIGDGAPPPVAADEVPGLLGEYFADIVPGRGQRLVARNEAVDFDWGTGAPAGVTADRFSARWSGSLVAPRNGRYRFQTVSDDGVRLWIGDTLVIDNWTLHAPTTDSSPVVVLEAGRRYPVRLEYYENYGGSTIRLRWMRPDRLTWEAVPAAMLRSPAAGRPGSPGGSGGQVPPAQAATCAPEHGLCRLPAGTTARVWYGVDSRWAVRDGVTGAIACSNTVFGDPAVGTFKGCRWMPS